MRDPVLVTGAAGFLGRRLVAALAADRVEVHAITRSVADVPGASVVRRVRSYAETPAVRGAVLIHLAGERSLAVAEANGAAGVVEASEVAAALAGKPYRGLILASSAVVYGDQSAEPHRPDEVVPPPRGRYAEAKLACEAPFVREGGLVLRLGNVYGPGMARDSVVAEIAAQIPGSGPVVVRNAGPVRDFVWIDDVIGAFVTAVRQLTAGILNIGSGRGTSIAALAATALKVARQESRPVQALQTSERPSVCVLDVSATRSALRWTAETSLESGLASLLAGARV